MRYGRHWLLITSAAALAGTAQAGETMSYSYDALGRLTRVSHAGTVNSEVTADYGHDAADNRTSVAVAAPNLPPPLIPGGGFEAPDLGTGFAAYAYAPTGGPAAFSGNSGLAGNASAWGFATAPEGDQVAFIANGPTPASLSLPVSGLTPGASYKISFRFTARPGYLGIPVTLAFDGSAIGTFAPQNYDFVATTSAPFTASAASGTLSFTGIASADAMASALDLVTVTPGGQP